jgi:hypothetical protein
MRRMVAMMVTVVVMRVIVVVVRVLCGTLAGTEKRHEHETP